MEKISTYNEIKLLRQNLKYRIQNKENKLKRQSTGLISGINTMIIAPLVEDGIHAIIRYLTNKFQQKKGNNPD